MPEELYTTAPREWGRWGAGDEVGRANLLTAARVVDAARCIRTGRRFSLALPVNADGSDPALPGRPATEHRMLRDHQSYLTGEAVDARGGGRSTDDWIGLACHGTTHLDALGHAYTGDELWNGHPATSTIGGLRYADAAALARFGIVGRALLADLPRWRGTERVPRGEQITIGEVGAALDAGGVHARPGDTILIRTGTAPQFAADRGPDGSWPEDEPGLTYEPELIAFVRDLDIAGLGTDTLCNEQAHSATVDAEFPLHVLLQRNLGVLFHEALWLEDWADDCAADGVYEAFYVAAPLRIRHASGGPMNPIVIK
ncbi:MULTISPECIES: cyclase family protein [unclassified Microbacterium]|uniref:cyclase family protein n=1 Tax=unclassified Microbacterium TaxID=2609290 RepID=UPI00301A3CBA